MAQPTGHTNSNQHSRAFPIPNRDTASYRYTDANSYADSNANPDTATHRYTCANTHAHSNPEVPVEHQ